MYCIALHQINSHQFFLMYVMCSAPMVFWHNGPLPCFSWESDAHLLCCLGAHSLWERERRFRNPIFSADSFHNARFSGVSLPNPSHNAGFSRGFPTKAISTCWLSRGFLPSPCKGAGFSKGFRAKSIAKCSIFQSFCAKLWLDKSNTIRGSNQSHNCFKQFQKSISKHYSHWFSTSNFK